MSYDYDYEDMAKEAEVRGVLAAFCDAGMLKVASGEAFDDLTEKVASVLDDYYTVDDVADAADFVIKTAEGEEKTPGSFKKFLNWLGRSYNVKGVWNDMVKNRGEGKNKYWAGAKAIGRIAGAYGTPAAAFGGTYALGRHHGSK